MTSWEFFGTQLSNIFIVYYFGDSILFFSTVSIGFLLLMIMAGLPTEIAFLSVLPLIAVFSAAGAFGTNIWVVNVLLLVAAVIYAYVILDLFS